MVFGLNCKVVIGMWFCGNLLLAHADALTNGQKYYPLSTGRLGNRYTDIAYGNGITVVVGSDGVINSQGLDQSSGTPKDLLGIAFANGDFVAIGEAGTILSSNDGLIWAQHIRPNSHTNYSAFSTRLLDPRTLSRFRYALSCVT